MAENSIGRKVWWEKLILIFSSECITSINHTWSLKAFAKKLNRKSEFPSVFWYLKHGLKYVLYTTLIYLVELDESTVNVNSGKDGFIIWSLKWHKWTLPHFIIISGCCVGMEVSVGMMGVLLYIANSTVWMPIAATS